MALKDNYLKNAKNIHFIGIGGIGISAIARMLLEESKRISGSDASDSLVTQELSRLGVGISTEHMAENIPKKTDLIIYTTAINKDNPELKEAKKRGILSVTYPEALGLISKDKYTIAVSGTHGKTTTTAMLSKILIGAKLDPTVVVGSFLKDKGSNFVAGKSKYLVCEACEYRRAFLNLTPRIVVITNIDLDHLDYYKDLADIQSAFVELVSKLGEKDYLVCDINEENLKPVLKNAKCKIINYNDNGLKINLKVPGEYNIKNAKTALTVSEILEVSPPIALRALNEFSGTWRRFEYKGKMKTGASVYDDYAHHPSAVKAFLLGLRDRFKGKKIFCVFQPHLFSRTKLLLNEFAESFSLADFVVVADIYASREKDDGSVNSSELVEKIKEFNPNAVYLNSFDKIEDYLIKNTGADDIVITMGAGDIFKVGENLIKQNP